MHLVAPDGALERAWVEDGAQVFQVRLVSESASTVHKEVSAEEIGGDSSLPLIERYLCQNDHALSKEAEHVGRWAYKNEL